MSKLGDSKLSDDLYQSKESKDTARSMYISLSGKELKGPIFESVLGTVLVGLCDPIAFEELYISKEFEVGEGEVDIIGKLKTDLDLYLLKNTTEEFECC